MVPRFTVTRRHQGGGSRQCSLGPPQCGLGLCGPGVRSRGWPSGGRGHRPPTGGPSRKGGAREAGRSRAARLRPGTASRFRWVPARIRHDGALLRRVPRPLARYMRRAGVRLGRTTCRSERGRADRPDGKGARWGSQYVQSSDEPAVSTGYSNQERVRNSDRIPGQRTRAASTRCRLGPPPRGPS
jgi:hypothetical protein